MRSAPASERRVAVMGGIGVPAILLAILLAAYRGQTGAVLLHVSARLPQLLAGNQGLQGLDGGFLLNVAVSLAAMAVALVLGTLLGSGLVAPGRAVRSASVLTVNLLRNSPWLVMIYAALYLIPFEVNAFGRTVTISPFLKATAGLSLPVLANMAEIVRGGIATVPSGQWEAAQALGYNRLQTLRHVVLPQAVAPMLPNVMNLYATLVIGTSLIVVTGTTDVLAVANTVLATDGAQLATAIDLCVLLLFFAYCFPIAIGSRLLERRWRRRR